MVDKVRPLKIENPAEGGTETDMFPTETDPTEDYVSAKGIALEENDSYLIDHTQGGLSTNMDITFYPNVSGYRQIRIHEDGSTQPDANTSTIMIYTGSPDEIYQVNFGSEEEPDWRDYHGISGAVTLKSYDGQSYDAGGSGQAGSTGVVTVTSGNAGGGDSAGGNSGNVYVTTGNAATGVTGAPGSPGWLYINPGIPGASGEATGSIAHVIMRGSDMPSGWGGTGGNVYAYGGKGDSADPGRLVLGMEPFADYNSPVSIGSNAGSAQLNVYNSAYFDYLTASKLVVTDGSKNVVSSSLSESDLLTTSLANGKIWVGNGSGVATAVTPSGDVTISNTGVTAIGTGKVTSTMILDGTILNADINASAAIAYSKLASMTSANILLGSSGNVPTVTAVTGDVTISNTGVTAIGTGKVTSTMILDGTILNADINASAAIDYSKLATLTGDVTISGNVSAIGTGKVTSTMILDGTILNADINASAAIAYSKLASMTSANILLGNGSGVPTVTAVTGDVTISNTGVTAIGSSKVTSAMIVDDTIVNADINSAAAIALSKLASQTSNRVMISGSGTITTSNNLTYTDGGTLTIAGSSGALNVQDSDGAPSFTMYYAGTSTNRLDIAQSDGNTRIFSMKAGAATLDFNAYPSDNTSNAAIRFNRDTNTSGTNNLFWYRGDNTTSTYASWSLKAGSGNTVLNNNAEDIDFIVKGDTDGSLFYVDAGADKVGISTNAPTEKLHLAAGNFLHEVSSSGASITNTLSNSSNTSSSKANQIIKVAGSTADDPFTTYTITSGSIANWSIGADNSDSDYFKISRASTLGTNDAIKINGSSQVNFPQTADFTNGMTVANDYVHTFSNGDYFGIGHSGGPTDWILYATASAWSTGYVAVDAAAVGYKFAVGTTSPSEVFHVATGNGLIQKSVNSGEVKFTVSNSHGGSSSNAVVVAKSTGSGLGFSRYTSDFYTQSWSAGFDSGQQYAIGLGTTPDTNQYFYIDVIGKVTAPTRFHAPAELTIPIGSNGSALSNNGDIELSNYSSVPGIGFQIDGTKYYIPYYGVIV